ncbi:hypothetical protein EDB80DRAFT_690739 [Ilyonectria destructans]|nr:hypothetical protein EDB80DRAFT_690739 [Ilyonectria destructans]
MVIKPECPPTPACNSGRHKPSEAPPRRTIEKRYDTQLNDAFTELRDSMPSMRVIMVKEGQESATKDPQEGTPKTIVDEEAMILASDPRDIVFALLGVSLEADEPTLQPDYQQDVDEVYKRVAKYMVKAGSANLLLDCALTGPPSGWPTWILAGGASPAENELTGRRTASDGDGPPRQPAAATREVPGDYLAWARRCVQTWPSRAAAQPKGECLKNKAFSSRSSSILRQQRERDSSFEAVVRHRETMAWGIGAMAVNAVEASHDYRTQKKSRAQKWRSKRDRADSSSPPEKVSAVLPRHPSPRSTPLSLPPVDCRDSPVLLLTSSRPIQSARPSSPSWLNLGSWTRTPRLGHGLSSLCRLLQELEHIFENLIRVRQIET